MIPVLQAGQGFLDDGIFSYKGKFKDAVKKLVQYIKKRAQKGGNLKQTKVKLPFINYDNNMIKDKLLFSSSELKTLKSKFKKDFSNLNKDPPYRYQRALSRLV